jgi:DNA-binding HxlR family transcriptional regulator
MILSFFILKIVSTKFIRAAAEIAIRFLEETASSEETIPDLNMLVNQTIQIMTTSTLVDRPNLLNKVEATEETKVASETVSAAEKMKAACDSPDHNQRMLSMRDAMDVLGGKWRLPIVGILSFKGKMRFTDILRSVHGIGAKMLSKELQDLEANQLLTRTVKQTKPITVEYEITEYGKTLTNLICEIVSWGMTHREKIMRGDQ